MGLKELFRRIRFLLHRRTYQRELQEEILLHRELRARQLVLQGTEPEEAAMIASRLFGNEELIKENANDMWGWNWLEDFLRDLRLTGRMLTVNPGFAVTAIFTLALGIGANTAIFSVTNALLLRAMPVNNPQQLYRVSCDRQPNRASNTGDSKTSFSGYVFQQLRNENNVLSDLMAYVPLGLNKISVRAGTLPEEAAAEMVSGNFFSGVGVRPLCGRLFNEQDEFAHAAIAIVSYEYAARRFGDHCAAVTQSIFIKGLPFTIAGVTPNGFTGVAETPTDVWIPFQLRPELNAWGMAGESYSQQPNWWCLRLMARVKPGITKIAAEAALNPRFQHAAYEPLGGKPASGERPTTLHLMEARGVAGAESLQEPLLVLQIMVGFLLLIAGGNVSMILAARNTARQREFSIRLALGGSQNRLVRQLLAESAALVSCGALLGLVFATLALPVLKRWAELETALALDRAVLIFTLGISITAVIVVGIAPAFRASHIPLAEAIKTSSATAYRVRSAIKTGNIIATVQLALCLTLLVETGLLVRTLQNLKNVNVGFRTSGLLVFGINPPFKENEPLIAFYRRLTAKLRSLPQVESVTLMGNRVASGWSNNTTALVDGRTPSDAPSDMLRWNNVGPNFFKTLGIRLAAGRDFDDGDSHQAAPVAIVNRTFVRQFLRGGNALGHTTSFTARKPFTIIGVVEDSKYTGIQESPVAMAWFPYTQLAQVGAMHIEMRTVGPPASSLTAVRETVAGLAPDLALLQPRSQEAEFDETILTQRLVARLAAAFAALAIILVTIGLYGTMSYNITRRTTEIGIRVALGAGRGHVVWMILRSGMLLCAIGLAVGVPLVLASTRVLASLLYGVSTTDPMAMTTAALGILGVGVIATFLPARRAASIDPIVALKYE